jgi:hypothetical protein
MGDLLRRGVQGRPQADAGRVRWTRQRQKTPLRARTRITSFAPSTRYESAEGVTPQVGTADSKGLHTVNSIARQHVHENWSVVVLSGPDQRLCARLFHCSHSRGSCSLRFGGPVFLGAQYLKEAIVIVHLTHCWRTTTVHRSIVCLWWWQWVFLHGAGGVISRGEQRDFSRGALHWGPRNSQPILWTHCGLLGILQRLFRPHPTTTEADNHCGTTDDFLDHGRSRRHEYGVHVVESEQQPSKQW